MCVPFEYNHIAFFLCVSRGTVPPRAYINKDYYDYGYGYYTLYRPDPESHLYALPWPQKVVSLLHIRGIVGAQLQPHWMKASERELHRRDPEGPCCVTHRPTTLRWTLDVPRFMKSKGHK